MHRRRKAAACAAVVFALSSQSGGQFADFESAKSEIKKKGLANKIFLQLTIDTKIEEDVFYPACKDKIDDGLWHEAYVEHDGAKLMIAEVESGNPGDEFYDAKMKCCPR